MRQGIVALTCGCTSSSRCPRADALWASANAVYYSQGYDAWMVALEPYNEHVAGDEEPVRAREEASYAGPWPALDRLKNERRSTA